MNKKSILTLAGVIVGAVIEGVATWALTRMDVAEEVEAQLNERLGEKEED